jgi:hypothetical protein
MISRGTVIAALFVVELAIIGEAFVAIRGDQPALSAPRIDAPAASGPHLVEDGPHEIFQAGAHPALTVDIGYADLTILTGKSSQIDVSLSGDTAFGVFRTKGPLVALRDGETIRIVATSGHRWSIGDDRMVTVLVPAETQVTVVKAGDIRASGLRAEASFNSIGHGSITVDDYDAPALHVSSSDGPIVLHRIVAPRLDATSSNDRIEGTALQVRDGTIESDGRVTLGFATGADTVITAKASDGKINLSGFSSGASGHASSADDDEDSSLQTVRVGSGDGRLDVHASDGNITLAQE